MERHPSPLPWVLAGLLGLALVATAVVAEEPKQGGPAVDDAAPDFRLNDAAGRAVRLSEHARDAWAIVAFFPKAATPG